MLLSKPYRALLRIKALREAQWFYKSEPSAFQRLKAAGPICPACATPASHTSDYPSRVAPFAQSSVHYCSTCGLGFVLGMKDALGAYYTEDYARANRHDRYVAPDAYFQNIDSGEDPAFATYVARSTRQLDLLAKHGAKGTKVLDYGSGPGYLLHLLKPKVAHAVEPDGLSHKYLSSLGATIHTDHTTLPERAFNTIIASHTIEHLPAEDLQEVLGKLMASLSPKGRMLIEVPQGGHSHLHLRGERQDPHTLFFTGQAMCRAIKSVGGKILFRQALGRIGSPRRDAPIYTPTGPKFFTTSRGSLTLICTHAKPKRYFGEALGI